MYNEKRKDAGVGMYKELDLQEIFAPTVFQTYLLSCAHACIHRHVTCSSTKVSGRALGQVLFCYGTDIKVPVKAVTQASALVWERKMAAVGGSDPQNTLRTQNQLLSPVWFQEPPNCGKP